MIEYCPELGARVWSGLVDKMLRIDVEITNSVEDDDDDDDEDDEDDEEDDMIRPGAPAIDPFDILVSQDVPHDGDETDDDDGEDSDDDEDPDIDALSTDEELESETERIIDEVKAAEKVAQQRRLKRANLKALRCKLDAMLTHFFRHLNESMGSSERGMSAAELGAQLHNTTLGSGSSSANSTPRGSRPATPTTATPTTSSAVLRPPPTPAQSLAHFQTLLNLFSRQILPTSATQHLPFVMFLCASFTPAHTELFLHLLVLQALYARTTDAPTLASQPVPLAQRSAATVYIGSLVCRARFVSDEQARTVAQYLLAYVEGKLTQAREQPLYTLDELPLFYAVCQAIMMIFCFRWRAFRGMTVSDDQVAGEMEMDDLGDEETGGEWMRDLDTLQRALTSDLNPLLGCNPTVVNTFAKVAHSTGFAYCFSIIEANQQAAARNASTTSLPKENGSGTTSLNTSVNGKRIPSGAGSSRQQNTYAMLAPRKARQTNVEAGLDGYFPFDPYDLPRSGEHVESLYRTWDEVAVDLGGDSSDEDDDDDDDEMEEMVSSDEDLALGPGRQSVPKAVHNIPRPSPGNSYGSRRRNMLMDGALSTSLETMSISPNISAL
jgi:RNA polymerase I-specific transcription initiation factor RRN3